MTTTTKVTILVGAPGSGKSTWAHAQWADAQDDAIVVVSADAYFERDGGPYTFDASKLGEAHGACLRGYVNFLMNRNPHIIVDNTNTTIAEIAPYYALAEAYGADVEILMCSNPGKNVHGVPDEVVLDMRRRVERLWEDAPRRWQIRELE